MRPRDAAAGAAPAPLPHIDCRRCGSASSASATSACPSRSRSGRRDTTSSATTSTASASSAWAPARATSRTSPSRAPRARSASDFAAGDRSRARSADCDAILICVPTPLRAEREPDLDLRPRLGARRSPAILREGQLVVLESTTYPGTTREEVLPLLEAWRPARSGRASTSPTRRSASTRAAATTRSPRRRRSSAGSPPACTERAVAVYSEVCNEVVTVSSPEAAELSKLLENIFRSVNIALVNELAQLTDRLGIDIWEVVDAASTKPFGFMRFEPGPGDGRPLPADRPLLPRLQGAPARLLHRVRRARRQDQPVPPAVLRAQDRACAERRRQGRERARRC